MRSSGSSSATETSPKPGPSQVSPRRNGFALTGRSRTLDPRTHAVRPDLADARLADRIFAPHYALPVRRTVARAGVLRDARGASAEIVVALVPGEAFDLLDVTGGIAWGIALTHQLVGYVDADALETAA